jgi:hypothetical protein
MGIESEEIEFPRYEGAALPTDAVIIGMVFLVPIVLCTRLLSPKMARVKAARGKRMVSTNGEGAWKSPFDREAVLTGLGRHEWTKQT